MRMKKILRGMIAVCLVLSAVLAMAGCKEEKSGYKKEHLPKGPEKFSRYYFQQYYPDNWGLLVGDDGYYYHRFDEPAVGKAGLVVQFVPNDNAENVKYSVYHTNESSVAITLETIANRVFDESLQDPRYYNNLYLDPAVGIRDTFVVTSEKPEKINYNIRQYLKVTYTFVVEGEDWRGEYYVSNGQSSYYIISFEAKADLWENYEPTFRKMIDDFEETGFEQEK